MTAARACEAKARRHLRQQQRREPQQALPRPDAPAELIDWDALPRSACSMCGAVLDDAAFSSDVTFTKGPGGESAVDGQRVSEAGVARGMGRIAGGRVYGHQVGRQAGFSRWLGRSGLVG